LHGLKQAVLVIEKQDHCVGGVEKRCLVHGVFHLNGVIERESAPWASSYASCGRTGSGPNRIVPTLPIATHATRTTSCATTNHGSPTGGGRAFQGGTLWES